jgi:uncharacterized protein with von Willebrand factor type A (vWA) domain
MPIDPTSKAATAIENNIRASYAPLIDDSSTIANHVGEQIEKWQLKTKKLLSEDFQFLTQEKQLEAWKSFIQNREISKDDFQNAIDKYIAFCKYAKHPTNEPFWKKQIAPASDTPRRKGNGLPRDDLSISARLLVDQWQKAIDQVRSEWELERIEALRAELLKQLDDFLRLLQQLKNQLEELGLDPGLLLDLSKGNLSAQDIEHFQRWAKYLAKDQGVRSLCELLGKVRQIALSDRIERVKVSKTRNIQLPDINSREEIIGLRLGRDLEHALPSELALLADDETAILFDLKYIESRLMCFDMQGIQRLQEHVETEEDRQVSEEEKQGPMVICVDTSGSMSGMPETIAKAVALFMAAKAKEQKRPCYLINFSTNIETLDLTNDFGMKSLINFLKMSFHGGTDVAPALSHALEVMQKDAYKKADLLIVSDFIMGSLPEAMLSQIEVQRVNGNRFYSLVVGSCYMTQKLKSLFDQEWIYNPQTSHIHELIGFQQRVEDQLKTSPDHQN